MRSRHAHALADLLGGTAADEQHHRFWEGHQTFVDNWADAVAAMSWCITAGESELLGRLLSASVSFGTCLPKPDLGELASAAMEMTDPPAGAYGYLAFFSDAHDQVAHAEAGLARQPTDPRVRALLYAQLAAGRASIGSGGALAALKGWSEAATDMDAPMSIAYVEGVFAESLVRWDPDAAAGHAERARKAIEGRHDIPLASQAMGNLAAYEAIRGRLESGLELADEAAELAGAAGYAVHGANAVATAARILAVLRPDDAAPVLADALETAPGTRWWFNVWPVLSGAGRWLVANGHERAGAVVDGYFESRGRSRSIDDFVPPVELNPHAYAHDREAGAAMSADEVVDLVLDALRTAVSPPE